MLHLEHLERTYAGRGGVTDVSLHAPPGAVYVLVGRNGAGKTTTLSVLTGRLFATRGTLVLDGARIPLDGPSVRPGLGYVADDPGLEPTLTPAQWLAYAAALKGAPRDGPAEEALARMLLLGGDVLDMPIRRLSFGNRRKVALWTELATTRSVLVLDEPLMGLDPPSIDAFHAAARHFTSTGRVILMSTHHLRDAETVATHVGIVDGGRTVAEGTLEQVRTAPTLHETYVRMVG
jgi:ABC-2 type transport system ATP-binding protein